MIFDKLNKSIKMMNNDYNRIQTKFESIELSSVQVSKDIATKVFLEDVSFKDANAMYIEAEEDTVEKKKNVFKSLVEWFKKVFNTIKEKIASLGSHKTKDEMVEVDPDIIKKAEEVSNYYKKIKTSLTKAKRGEVVAASEELDEVPVPDAIKSSDDTVTEADKKVQMSKSKVDSIVKDLKDINDDIEDTVDGIDKGVDKTESGEYISKANIVGKILKTIMIAIAKIIAILVAAVIIVNAITTSKEYAIPTINKSTNNNYIGQKGQLRLGVS